MSGEIELTRDDLRMLDGIPVIRAFTPKSRGSLTPASPEPDREPEHKPDYDRIRQLQRELDMDDPDNVGATS